MPIFDSLTKTQPTQLETFTITITYDNTTPAQADVIPAQADVIPAQAGNVPRTVIMYAASVAMSEGPSRLRTGDLSPYLTAKATTEMIKKVP